MQQLEPRSSAGAASQSASARSRVRETLPARSARAEASGSLLRDGFLSLLLFLLLAEWLIPLPLLSELSEIYMIKPFLVVFGLCIAMDSLRVPYAWGWAAKSVIILIFIGFMFYGDEFMTGVWVADLVRSAVQDTVHLFEGRLELISAQSRTLLFLLGWTLMISVTQALMLQRQHSLWFVGATMTYLVGLQLALGADTTAGIIRTLGYGLLLLAMLNLSRIEAVYGLTGTRGGAAFAWLAASAVLIGLLAGAGWFGASTAASRPMMKPVDLGGLSDRLFSLYEDNPGLQAAAAKSGYGNNDAVLGGPLQADDTVVFTAKSTDTTYWRGESKSYYDGKGWTQPEPSWEIFDPAGVRASGRTVTQEVLWDSKYAGRQLFYGGTLVSIDALVSDRDKPVPAAQTLINTMTGKVAVPDMSDPLSYYKITVAPATKEPSILRADTGAYPSSVVDMYLQLPAQLPKPVRKLAEDITAGSATPYDKAAAIEQYLRSHYKYSLDKPTRPGKAEDFVSHFLFVDQTGYCDHFSTAMTVMLRAVGVPARWVKGYAPGEEGPSSGQGLHEFTVKNKDAHAWVEVYFPKTGWVPFEPTPGFDGPGAADAARAPAHERSSEAHIAAPEVGQNAFSMSGRLQAKVREIRQALAAANWPQLSMGTAVVLVLSALLIVWRQWNRGRGYNPVIAGADGRTLPLVRFMDRLWLQLFKRYGMMSSQQTVREYVSSLQLDNESQKQALLQFALAYETMRYASAPQSAYSKPEIVRLWKAFQSAGQEGKGK